MTSMYNKSGLLAGKFDKVLGGKQTRLYILKNQNECEIAVTNFGAKIVSIVVPDRNGNFVDVVLGHSGAGRADRRRGHARLRRSRRFETSAAIVRNSFRAPIDPKRDSPAFPAT